MPKLEAALYDYLSDDSEVASHVGDRIFPVRLPEGVKLPAISWTRVSASRLYTYDSFEETAAFVRARIQFNCWATTPIQAMEIGEAVLKALSGYNGIMAGTQQVDSSFAVLEMDDYETGAKLYRRILDILLSYSDDLATSS